MILRDGSNGRYEIYDIGSNAILAGDFLGQVATNWAFVTLGGFNGSDTTDMLLRDNLGGGFQVYDISNNNIANVAFLGAVGMDWQVMGFGNFSSRGETDMILRNSNTGGVEGRPPTERWRKLAAEKVAQVDAFVAQARMIRKMLSETLDFQCPKLVERGRALPSETARPALRLKRNTRS